MFFFLMFRICKNDKIFDSIVERISVYVMNVFIFGKRSLEMLFHDESMFSNFLSVYGDGFVFMRRHSSFLKSVNFDVFLEMDFGETCSRTKLSFFSSIFWDVKGLFAKLANEDFSDFGPFCPWFVKFIYARKRTKNMSRSSFFKFQFACFALGFPHVDYTDNSYCFVGVK